MPRLRKVSGHNAVKILCNKFGFSISGRSGSHVRLSKIFNNTKIGTVVPLHKELKIGTLKNALKLAKVDETEFAEFI